MRWIYTDGSGVNLQQYGEMSTDFIANAMPAVAGGDRTQRPDPNDIKARITSNFPVPGGATIVLTLISSSQVAAVYY